MNFLNQLKSQATTLQQQQQSNQARREAAIKATELACQTVWSYFHELAQQLNVIKPAGPRIALEHKKPWPETQLVEFAFDARKKRLGDQEVFDFIALAWSIVPATGVGHHVASANFPTDLQKIEAGLAAGGIKHHRLEVRHPEKNTLQEIRFEYQTQARGGVTVKPNHESAQLEFHLRCLRGLKNTSTAYSADQVQPALLDELAKLVVGQSSTFCLID